MLRLQYDGARPSAAIHVQLSLASVISICAAVRQRAARPDRSPLPPCGPAAMPAAPAYSASHCAPRTTRVVSSESCSRRGETHAWTEASSDRSVAFSSRRLAFCSESADDAEEAEVIECDGDGGGTTRGDGSGSWTHHTIEHSEIVPVRGLWRDSKRLGSAQARAPAPRRAPAV